MPTAGPPSAGELAGPGRGPRVPEGQESLQACTGTTGVFLQGASSCLTLDVRQGKFRDCRRSGRILSSLPGHEPSNTRDLEQVSKFVKASAPRLKRTITSRQVVAAPAPLNATGVRETRLCKQSWKA